MNDVKVECNGPDSIKKKNSMLVRVGEDFRIWTNKKLDDVLYDIYVVEGISMHHLRWLSHIFPIE